MKHFYRSHEKSRVQALRSTINVWCHTMSRVRDITMPPQFRGRMVGLWISKEKTDHVITPPRKRLLCVPYPSCVTLRPFVSFVHEDIQNSVVFKQACYPVNEKRFFEI